jgi:3-dehydroquinate synthase
MSKILSVEINSGVDDSYNIVIEPDFIKLADILSVVFATCNKFMLVFDSNTDGYFKDEVSRLLSNTKKIVSSFTFTAGEDNKNLTTVYKLYEKLIKEKFERNDVILAVGGGVVGDLAGFCAATYLRGIRFAQLPTTLLAMSDSSVGGKTGVDFLSYKNMVGAFHQPKLVYMNVNTLISLPEREYLSGMAEVIKYGYIYDKEFIDYLRDNANKVLDKDYLTLEYIIFHSCRIKKEVVEKDSLEDGLRAILNYGHTIGHAVEKLMEFKLLHGECVALGMVAAARIALSRGLMSEEEFSDMKDILVSFKLFRRINLSEITFSKEDILTATKSDKKMQGGRIKFVLTTEIGRAEIYRDVTDEELMLGINEVFEG